MVFFPPPQRNSPLLDSISLSRFHEHFQLDTPQSVGLLWTSVQPDAETSTWQHTTLTRDRRLCRLYGIRTHNLSSREATDPRLRSGGHCDRLRVVYIVKFPLTSHDVRRTTVMFKRKWGQRIRSTPERSLALG